MRPNLPSPVSRRLHALGPEFRMCPVCKRADILVGGGQDVGHWIIQPHAPINGGIILCVGTNQSISLTFEEKASP